MAEAGLSLGSNLGDKAAMVDAALNRLDGSAGVKVLRRSHFYRTEPWGDPDQDWFLNACAIVETDLPPQALLRRCLDIETELGRDRAKSRKWGPRPIDIDVLFHGNAEIAEPGLILPHPHLFERGFVLIPLNEIAGDRVIGGRTISDAASAVDAAGVFLWTPTP
jgi:2-amino-4-hydroxy-6-hydroxymethyldihydropteridine diphosphokinase